jgi:hypothetical protein
MTRIESDSPRTPLACSERKKGGNTYSDESGIKIPKISISRKWLT